MRYSIALNVIISYKKSSRRWFVYVNDAKTVQGSRPLFFLTQKWFKGDSTGRLSVMALQKKLMAFGLAKQHPNNLK
jgi:hypothetical protein